MMRERMKTYNKLNELAEENGIVIFGGNEDTDIPVGELRQAFDVDSKIYNRSLDGLTVDNAVNMYNECVAPLSSETILLHIGEADLDTFDSESHEFDNKYRELIRHIRRQNEKCRIAIISMKNYENDKKKSEMNRRLKYIAESEHCEFGDIASKKVWNPKSTMETASFIYSLGFVRPLRTRRPIYDLVKILFCCGA